MCEPDQDDQPGGDVVPPATLVSAKTLADFSGAVELSQEDFDRICDLALIGELRTVDSAARIAVESLQGYGDVSEDDREGVKPTILTAAVRRERSPATCRDVRRSAQRARPSDGRPETVTPNC